MEPAIATIVFFGNERLATGLTTDAPTLRALIAAGYDVAAVVSNQAQHRSSKARQLEIEDVAHEHAIPLLLPAKPAEIIDQLRSFDAVIGVLIAYGKIVPQSVIDVFPRGIVNVHPSLLPLHRGSIPVESVLLSGEQETGVSIMQLVKAMDAGPVYAQRKLPLQGNETKADLAARLLDMGKAMVLEHLPAIIDGSLQPTPQNDSKATYDNLLKPEDSLLDFNKPAAQLEREIRAYADWPKSRTRLAGREAVITKAHVETGHIGEIGQALPTAGPTASRAIAIQTSDGILVIDQFKPAGKAEMTAAAFLAGNKL
jgi:methionyl-tRNA formyltransferase